MFYNTLVVLTCASLFVVFGLATVGLVTVVRWRLSPGAVNRKGR